jgi:hypothetical protein
VNSFRFWLNKKIKTALQVQGFFDFAYSQNSNKKIIVSFAGLYLNRTLKNKKTFSIVFI